MLTKLLKYDLKKNIHWLWILFASTIVFAGIARGCKELGASIAFFKILGIIFESVFYTLAINCIIQPFLRSFLNFTKSFYSDEAYLTHTLPVTKTQLLNSKFITSLIEMLLAFITIIIALLIEFASPNMFEMLRLILSTTITGSFSLFWILTLFVILVIVEFYMFISIIFFSVVVAYKSREKRVLKSFIYSAIMAFAFLTALSIVMIIVLVINKVNLSSSTLILSNTAFISVLLTGIIVYSLAILACYFLTKHQFNKGVNVD